MAFRSAAGSRIWMHSDTSGRAKHLFNGFSRDTVRSTRLRKCGIDKAGPLITHGVLLDLPAHFGVEYLGSQHTIAAAEMTGCLADAGVQLQAGDAVLVRTGWPLLFAQDPVGCQVGWAGLGVESATWLARQDEPHRLGQPVGGAAAVPVRHDCAADEDLIRAAIDVQLEGAAKAGFAKLCTEKIAQLPVSLPLLSVEQAGA